MTDIVDDVVAEYREEKASDYARQMYAERWRVHLVDRTIDVVACIGEPFSYADVQACVQRVVLADGWELPRDRFGHSYLGAYDIVRSTMRDLEDASQITRIRAEAGTRPHLWVRTHERTHYRRDGQP